MSDEISLETLLLYVEYGYKACEKGWNLEKTFDEFKKEMEEQ